MSEATPAGDGRLTVDRLPDPTDPVQIHRIEGLRLAASDVREPHRHDDHGCSGFAPVTASTRPVVRPLAARTA